MMLNEQEARTKVCRAPGALSWLMAEHGSKSPSGPIPEPRCIASDCMMWRWKGAEYVRSVTPGVGATIHEYRDNPEARTLGFCGLAGNPRVP